MLLNTVLARAITVLWWLTTEAGVPALRKCKLNSETPGAWEVAKSSMYTMSFNPILEVSILCPGYTARDEVPGRK